MIDFTKIPQWLVNAVNLEGGFTLCEREIFHDLNGTWTVWIWKDDDLPVTGLPSKAIAERVCHALHDAYRAGGNGDYHYCE